MSRILVTGGAGFLGRRLAEALASAGHAVSRLDLAGPEGTVVADLRDAGATRGALASARPDVVYHLAAVLALAAEGDASHACAVNVQGTVHLLEAARGTGVGLVVLASSVAVHDGRLAYGASKVAAEAFARYYVEARGLDVRVLRLPSLVGAGRAGESLTGNVSRLVLAAARGEAFEAPLPPEMRLPLLYDRDGVLALRALGEAPRARLDRTTYEVAGLEPPPSLGEVADAVRRRVPGARLTFRPDPAVVARASRVAAVRLDGAAFAAATGFRPAFGLDAMVEDLLRAC